MVERPLYVRLDGQVHRLEPGQVHYLSTHDGGMALRPRRDDATFGWFASQLGNWWIHTEPDRVPKQLLFNGRGLLGRSTQLATDGVVELWLSRGPSAPTPPPGQQRSGRPDRRRVWSIGRTGTKADIQVDDPLVRADHAWMEVDGRGRWWITQNTGRVYVDGNRVWSAALDEGSVFVVGQTAVAASPALLSGGWTPDNPPPAQTRATVGVSAGAGLAVEVRDVVVHAGGGKVLLDGVSLSAAPGELVAVVGPSGAGKSTLIRVLLGDIVPSSGTVSVGGAPGRHRPAKPADRRQMHYVPQADDLYRVLTVGETLEYAARFRSAPDASDAYIAQRVQEALTALGLQRHRDARVHTLSGGQQRRVSIGIELVGNPQLLILDEPTSGLDLAKDREIMRQLRHIAERFHCTVIVVTHAVMHLGYADKLVVLGHGGQVRYSGPPVRPAEQGFTDWADWLEDLDRPRPQKSRGATRTPPTRARRAGYEPSPSNLRWALARQAKVIARRGPLSLAALGAMPLIGTLFAVFAAKTGLDPAGAMTQVLSILVTVAALTGAALTYLDLVNDRKIVERDWRVGVSSLSLLLAKSVVYGVICVVLSGAMTLLYAALRDLPRPAFGIAPSLMLLLTLLCIMTGSMGLGLLISALAASVERAVTYQTLLAVAQVALSGALFQIAWWLNPFTLPLPGRLGLAAVAAYADLNRYRHGAAFRDDLWTSHPIRFWLLLLAMLAVAAGSMIAAARLTERRYIHG